MENNENVYDERAGFLFNSVESARNVIDNIPALVFINEAWMESGNYRLQNIFANLLAYFYTGYTQKDCAAMGCNFASNIIHPDEYSLSFESFDYLLCPENAGSWFTTSYRFRIKSGLYLWGFGSVKLMNVLHPNAHRLFMNCLLPICDPMRLDNVARKLLEENRKNGRAIIEKLLSPREMEVLEYIAFGYSVRMISEKLEIGEESVKSHIGGLRGKLHLHSLQALTCFAWQYGLIGI